jgi:ATP-binding cassette subfamily B protein RaxB
VLALDEATSHLDVERERAVTDNLRQLAVTRLVIAHRPDTIAGADRVVVLEAGRLVEARSVNDEWAARVAAMDLTALLAATRKAT